MIVIIVGAGGQGAIVADALARAREHGAPAIVGGFVDDTRVEPVAGFPILGRIDDLPQFAHDAVIVAVGDNRARRTMTERLVRAGERLATARHPFTSVAPDAILGEGSMLSAGAIAITRARIGRGVLLNTKSSVDHDTVVEDFAHVSAGATVGAGCFVGEETMIGMAATVMSGCRVGARCIIGAGSVVVRDIPDDVVAFGVPARVQRSR